MLKGGEQMAIPTSIISLKRLLFVLGFVATMMTAVGMARANEVRSLKDVPVPEPYNLGEFVADKQAAIALGKALFWDMQVGSDGATACATCHFNAGADTRTRNQISPGLLAGDTQFGNSAIAGKPGHPGFGPNYRLRAADFPTHRRNPATQKVPRPNPLQFVFQVDNEFATVVRDTNDVISSQGVRLTQFDSIFPGSSIDNGTPLNDEVFQVGGRNVRRVEPRNAPTMINAAFNFDNFWDGRASAIFNGVNPFGFRDLESTLKKGDPGNPEANLQDVFVRIPNASLASQAVGPPLSDFEMSFRGRSFPLLGRKLSNLKPLADQLVHPNDSVLGELSQATLTGRRVRGAGGLNVATYAEMVKKAFKPEWWNSNMTVSLIPGTEEVKTASLQDPRSFVASSGDATVNRPGVLKAQLDENQFTQMEWNFSLFFGLAVQLYEATLISDNTPFDRFVGSPLNVRGDGPIDPDPRAMSAQEQLGMDIFFGTNVSGRNAALIDGKCTSCHRSPEFTNHSVRNVGVNPADPFGVPRDIIETMLMADGKTAFYDAGFYNIASRPTEEDIARAATAPNLAPFINPKTQKPFPLSYVELALLKRDGNLPDEVARFVPDLPQGPFFDELGNPLLPPENDRVAVRGAFKASSLRNIEFSGPYLHSGMDATLRHVVEFYVRGGNFPATNFNELDPDMEGIAGLDPAQDRRANERMRALVAFLANGLTDPRVRFEQAPFDHPQLFIPDGAQVANAGNDVMVELPPVGREGSRRSLSTFLNLNPQRR
jgi:cytochrome c peroxidase